jgi:Winged helix DNA-binding domain
VDLLAGRRVVGTLLMRRTMHLVTSEDCLELRPLHDAMLVARMKGTLGRRLPGVDFEELAAAGAPLFAEMPRTLSEVAGTIKDRWPGASRGDLGDALSTLVPLVQIPPRGIWGQRAPARNTTVEVLRSASCPHLTMLYSVTTIAHESSMTNTAASACRARGSS